MPEPEISAKTPALKDKRLWFAVGTIVSLFVSQYTGREFSPELLATIASIVIGFMGVSGAKEAQVAKAQIAADTATELVKSQADAAAVLRGQ